jgi:hypothetical protein
MKAVADQQHIVVPTEPIPWPEICARYPDQFVCLVDVVAVERGSPRIATGRVVGNGPTRRDAFDPIRNELQYTEWWVRFTGKSRKPLRRPPVLFDG